MQLAVLERESQGLLPRQRRGRLPGLPIPRAQPYHTSRSSSQGEEELQRLSPSSSSSDIHNVFKAPSVPYSMLTGFNNVKLASSNQEHRGIDRFSKTSSMLASPASSLNAVNTFGSSPKSTRRNIIHRH